MGTKRRVFVICDVGIPFIHAQVLSFRHCLDTEDRAVSKESIYILVGESQ